MYVERPYSGPGRREGVPGHYRYYYDGPAAHVRHYRAAAPYVSPRQRTLTAEEAHVRDVAVRLRDGDPAAVAEAAEKMSAAVLVDHPLFVPLPSSHGTTDANRALAGAIAARTGGRVLDVLERAVPVESSRERRRSGRVGLQPHEHGIRLREPLPPGPVYFVDNVLTTGSTAAAARAAAGHRGTPLVWAKAEEVVTPPVPPPARPPVRFGDVVGRALERRARPLTAERDRQRADIAEQTFAPDTQGVPDYTDYVGDPATWMTAAELRTFAATHLEADDRSVFLADPATFVSSDAWHPGLDFALDVAWQRFYSRQTKPLAHERAVARTFAGRPSGVVAYASGSSRPADIRGLQAAGHPIGVAANELTPEAVRTLRQTTVPIFVDSGAFSEVGGETIPPAEWTRRLGIYRDLGSALAGRLTVVAPDKVGDQAETIRRLAAHADAVRAVAATGAAVLLPLQQGAHDLVTFEALARRAAPGVDFVPALPMKRAATPIPALVAYVRARQPARLHLLGIGPENRDAAQILAAIRRESPDTVVTLDSNRIRAQVGYDKPRVRSIPTGQLGLFGNTT